MIYWTLGNFLKPLATIYLPNSPTFLGNYCKVFHFSSEIIFGQLLLTFGDFFWSQWLWPMRQIRANNRQYFMATFFTLHFFIKFAQNVAIR